MAWRSGGMAAFRMSGSMEHIFLIIVVDRHNHGRCPQAEKGRMMGAKSHGFCNLGDDPRNRFGPAH